MRRFAHVIAVAASVSACSIQPDRTDAVSGVHGFLLDAGPVEGNGFLHAPLSPADQVDLVLFFDRDCSICYAALQQAHALSSKKKVLLAPMVIGTRQPEVQPSHNYENAIWAANAAVFERTGASSIPFWSGRDGCGKPFRIAGVLNDADIAALKNCGS